MICKKPFIKNGVAFGCGQCMPCRINKKRLWTHRITLESLCHKQNSFLTLTYDTKNLPEGFTLDPNDTKNWLKKFRKIIHPHKIRYFLVGEYGDISQRPHYHVALFNYPPCKNINRYQEKNCMCGACLPIVETWDKGLILNAELNPESASYIAGYVTKKMTNKNDKKVQEELNGRHQEFTRMSLKPGIGALAIPKIIETLETDIGCQIIENNNDVPSFLCHGKKKLPLGRYLKEKLRVAYGFKEKGTPKENLLQLSKENFKEYLELREKSKLQGSKTQKELLIERDKQKVLSTEKRYKIFSQKRSI